MHIAQGLKTWQRATAYCALLSALALVTALLSGVDHLPALGHIGQYIVLVVICLCQLEWFGWEVRLTGTLQHILYASSWSGALLTLLAAVALIDTSAYFADIWVVTSSLFGALFSVEWALWDQLELSQRVGTSHKSIHPLPGE